MITIQQAIDYLRDPICVGLSTKEKLKLHEEAVAMAITALKNFPTQMSGTSGNCSELPNSSDCISRQAAIDAIVNTVSKMGLHDNSEVARYGATFRQHEIIDIIEGLPSAQPERKKGKWYDLGSLSCRCSECGCKSQKESSFCPNCGADMRGEQSE